MDIKELLLSNNYEDKLLACNIMIRTLTKHQANKIMESVSREDLSGPDDSYSIIRKKNSWGFNTYTFITIESKKDLDEWIHDWESDNITITEI